MNIKNILSLFALTLTASQGSYGSPLPMSGSVKVARDDGPILSSRDGSGSNPTPNPSYSAPTNVSMTVDAYLDRHGFGPWKVGNWSRALLNDNSHTNGFMRWAFSLNDIWKQTSLSPEEIDSTAREFVGLQAKVPAMDGMLIPSPYNATKNNVVLIMPRSENLSYLSAAGQDYVKTLPSRMVEPIKTRNKDLVDRKISMSVAQLNATAKDFEPDEDGILPIDRFDYENQLHVAIQVGFVDTPSLVAWPNANRTAILIANPETSPEQILNLLGVLAYQDGSDNNNFDESFFGNHSLTGQLLQAALAWNVNNTGSVISLASPLQNTSQGSSSISPVVVQNNDFDNIFLPQAGVLDTQKLVQNIGLNASIYSMNYTNPPEMDWWKLRRETTLENFPGERDAETEMLVNTLANVMDYLAAPAKANAERQALRFRFHEAFVEAFSRAISESIAMLGEAPKELLRLNGHVNAATFSRLITHIAEDTTHSFLQGPLSGSISSFLVALIGVRGLLQLGLSRTLGKIARAPMGAAGFLNFCYLLAARHPSMGRLVLSSLVGYAIPWALARLGNLGYQGAAMLSSQVQANWKSYRESQLDFHEPTLLERGLQKAPIPGAQSAAQWIARGDQKGAEWLKRLNQPWPLLTMPNPTLAIHEIELWQDASLAAANREVRNAYREVGRLLGGVKTGALANAIAKYLPEGMSTEPFRQAEMQARAEAIRRLQEYKKVDRRNAAALKNAETALNVARSDYFGFLSLARLCELIPILVPSYQNDPARFKEWFGEVLVRAAKDARFLNHLGVQAADTMGHCDARINLMLSGLRSQHMLHLVQAGVLSVGKLTEWNGEEHISGICEQFIDLQLTRYKNRDTSHSANLRDMIYRTANERFDLAIPAGKQYTSWLVTNNDMSLMGDVMQALVSGKKLPPEELDGWLTRAGEVIPEELFLKKGFELITSKNADEKRDIAKPLVALMESTEADVNFEDAVWLLRTGSSPERLKAYRPPSDSPEQHEEKIQFLRAPKPLPESQKGCDFLLDRFMEITGIEVLSDEGRRLRQSESGEDRNHLLDHLREMVESAEALEDEEAALLNTEGRALLKRYRDNKATKERLLTERAKLLFEEVIRDVVMSRAPVDARRELIPYGIAVAAACENMRIAGKEKFLSELPEHPLRKWKWPTKREAVNKDSALKGHYAKTFPNLFADVVAEDKHLKAEQQSLVKQIEEAPDAPKPPELGTIKFDPEVEGLYEVDEDLYKDLDIMDDSEIIKDVKRIDELPPDRQQEVRYKMESISDERRQEVNDRMKELTQERQNKIRESIRRHTEVERENRSKMIEYQGKRAAYLAEYDEWENGEHGIRHRELEAQQTACGEHIARNDATWAAKVLEVVEAFEAVATSVRTAVDKLGKNPEKYEWQPLAKLVKEKLDLSALHPELLAELERWVYEVLKDKGIKTITIDPSKLGTQPVGSPQGTELVSLTQQSKAELKTQWKLAYTHSLGISGYSPTDDDLREAHQEMYASLGPLSTEAVRKHYDVTYIRKKEQKKLGDCLITHVEGQNAYVISDNKVKPEFFVTAAIQGDIKLEAGKRTPPKFVATAAREEEQVKREQVKREQAIPPKGKALDDEQPSTPPVEQGQGEEEFHVRGEVFNARVIASIVPPAGSLDQDPFVESPAVDALLNELAERHPNIPFLHSNESMWIAKGEKGDQLMGGRHVPPTVEYVVMPLSDGDLRGGEGDQRYRGPNAITFSGTHWKLGILHLEREDGRCKPTLYCYDTWNNAPRRASDDENTVEALFAKNVSAVLSEHWDETVDPCALVYPGVQRKQRGKECGFLVDKNANVIVPQLAAALIAGTPYEFKMLDSPQHDPQTLRTEALPHLRSQTGQARFERPATLTPLEQNIRNATGIENFVIARSDYPAQCSVGVKVKVNDAIYVMSIDLEYVAPIEEGRKPGGWKFKQEAFTRRQKAGAMDNDPYRAMPIYRIGVDEHGIAGQVSVGDLIDIQRGYASGDQLEISLVKKHEQTIASSSTPKVTSPSQEPSTSGQQNHGLFSAPENDSSMTASDDLFDLIDKPVNIPSFDVPVSAMPTAPTKRNTTAEAPSNFRLEYHGLTEDQGKQMQTQAGKGKSYQLRHAKYGESMGSTKDDPAHVTNQNSIAFHLKDTPSASQPLTFVVISEQQIKDLGLKFDDVCGRLARGEEVAITLRRPNEQKASTDSVVAQKEKTRRSGESQRISGDTPGAKEKGFGR